MKIENYATHSKIGTLLYLILSLSLIYGYENDPNKVPIKSQSDPQSIPNKAPNMS